MQQKIIKVVAEHIDSEKGFKYEINLKQRETTTCRKYSCNKQSNKVIMRNNNYNLNL